jgi:hypothetical protein
MSQEIRYQIDKVKNYKNPLNENFETNNNINKFFINKIAKLIGEHETGVLDVDVSNIKYDEDGNIFNYNNTIRAIFENASFYGFNLEKYNQHDANADKNKMLNHLEKSNKILDLYLLKINKIKTIITQIKNVVSFVDSLNLESNKNIKKIGYSIWKNQLLITIYKEV